MSSIQDAVSLQTLILKDYKTSVFDTIEREFLPERSVAKLITEDSIIGELEIQGSNLENREDKALVNFIFQHAKKVFAIAVIIDLDGSNLRRAMEKFKDSGFRDESLPVKKEDLSKPCFSGTPWTKPVRVQNFFSEQWKFLSPVFSKTRFQLSLEPDCILPFIWKSSDVKYGAFSQVFEVKIHESHWEDPVKTIDGRLANVAIKEIKHGSNDDSKRPVNISKEFKAEANVYDELSDLNHPNIIQRIAAITRGGTCCFMFQWADGGSLRDFWQSQRPSSLTPDFVKEIVQQLQGLAGALNDLHTYGTDDESYRHGDLKPENILRFEDGTTVGILKIADMGLAKHHFLRTGDRQQTSTRFGTARYEPPEVEPQQSAAAGRSRLYDIWSMGCITLELIVWLLYGFDELMKFNESMKTHRGEYCPYYEIVGDEAKVHSAVQECMDHLSTDPECTKGSAMRDLLDIVKNKLLVVALPNFRPSARIPSKGGGSVPVIDVDAPVLNIPSRQPGPPVPTRASARVFFDSLEKMMSNGKTNDSYWFTGTARGIPKGPRPRTLPVIRTLDDRLSPNAARGQIDDKKELFPAKQSTQLATAQKPNLNKLWEFPVDNTFANNLFADMATAKVFPRSPRAAKLCGKCQKLNFWESRFRMKDVLSELEEQSTICEFCKMRWDLCKDLDRKQFSSVWFDRLESTLRMNESNPPVLSLCRSPDQEPPREMPPIQIGLPELPAAGSESHLKILQQWLKNCDDNHPKCQPPDTAPLPTRLIDVIDRDSPTLFLYDTQPKDSMKYIALSHPWGDPPHFCTFTSNIEKHHQKIEFDHLPATFQNAVTTTRALGFRYLWIDSICIIQGEDGDFNREAKRMEDVFSSAWCVLAASSAKGQSDGFLKRRDEREYLTFVRDGMPELFVCRFIDDFNQHVLDGSLNKRGWVLQERALAHRTIYFTSKQTFWECGGGGATGGGVRCETLTKMNNTLTSFLGDPNFPEVAIRSTKGGQILLYQDLYKQYSRLHFTRIWDRPIAIAGLEKRLIEAFKQPGGFGVLDDGGGVLRRSLFWHRGDDEPTLERIVCPVDRKMTVPTWSWMAYKGGIDYLKLPFGDVDWVNNGVCSPWTPGSSRVWHTGDQAGIVELSAEAREFDSKTAPAQQSRIIYDIPQKTDGGLGWHVMCVVVGRLKGGSQPERNRMHYVLLVTPKVSQAVRGGQACERVGVGFIPGGWIKFDQPGTAVRIH